MYRAAMKWATEQFTIEFPNCKIPQMLLSAGCFIAAGVSLGHAIFGGGGLDFCMVGVIAAAIGTGALLDVASSRRG